MKHLEAINAIPSFYPEFRNVLWTGESSQLVVMTVPVGGDIGEEVSLGLCLYYDSLSLGWGLGFGIGMRMGMDQSSEERHI
jgi:hypothetical protein